MVAAGVVRPAEPGAESEVGELDVAAAVDEHVVGLDVAVDEAHPMDAVDGQHKLGDEEPRQWLVEHAQPDQQTHQVAAGDVLHHEVQARRVLRANSAAAVVCVGPRTVGPKRTLTASSHGESDVHVRAGQTDGRTDRHRTVELSFRLDAANLIITHTGTRALYGTENFKNC